MEHREEKINWIDCFLNVRSSKLNKSISKISPRRGKHIPRELNEIIKMFESLGQD